jgi:hypothetical protein
MTWIRRHRTLDSVSDAAMICGMSNISSWDASTERGRLSRSSPATTIRTLLLFVCALLVVPACSRNDNPPANEPPASASPGTSSGQATQRAYTLGTTIGFGKNGDSERFRVSGWSDTEDDKTWTEGTSATLAFSGLPEGRALQLRTKIGGLAQPPQVPSQPVEVYANGTKIADWTVSDNTELTAPIPANVVKDGALKIEFKTPKAASPKSLGQNEDARVLGIRMFTLAIESTS